MATSTIISAAGISFGGSEIPLLGGTIGDVLRRNAAQWGDRPAFIWAEGPDVRRMAYTELLDRAERVAHWLLERVATGDRIGIWSLNSIDYAVLFYGSALAGTIIVPFNPAWTEAEARHSIEVVRPALILTSADRRAFDLGERARAVTDCLIEDLAVLADLPSAKGTGGLPELPTSHPYLIQFTSGTTGRAKAALISHRAALAGGWIAHRGSNADERAVWFTPMPFYHTGGSISIMMGALTAGGGLVIVKRFITDEVVRLIKPSGTTRMGGVPTMWFDMLRHPDFPDDLKLDAVTLGGAVVPTELIQEIEARTGSSVLNCFGQSEFSVATSTVPNDDVLIKSETIGRALPHVEIKVSDPATGETLPYGEVGEFCVRGPQVMDGYWGDPEATAAAFDAEGFRRTGDLGTMDADGICRIRGRASELIIRGGMNIYPAEVESALLQHPDIVRAAAIGLPDPRLGQRVAAVVELRDGASVSEADLAGHAAALISYFKVPSEWRIVDAMPMTASGKPRKIELAPLFAA